MTSNDAIQHVLHNTDKYVKPEAPRRAAERMIGKGLLTAAGEDHKKQRKLLNPAFGVGYIRGMVSIMLAKALELVEMLEKEVEAQSSGGIDVSGYLGRAALDIIGAAGFSYLATTLTHLQGSDMSSIRRTAPVIRWLRLTTEYLSSNPHP